MVLDREGRVLASNLPITCGERCARRCSASASIARSMARRNSSGPRADPALVFHETQQDGLKRPLAWLLAPIRGGTGPVPAVLAIGVLADREFARLFASARATTTTEAFAFGDDGLLLTSTRYAKEFVESGFYPDRNRFGRVRRAGARPRAATSRPDTCPPSSRLPARSRMPAALAIAARSKSAESDWRGVVIEPYRTYSGRETVGRVALAARLRFRRRSPSAMSTRRSRRCATCKSASRSSPASSRCR